MKEKMIELLTDTLSEWECEVQPETVSEIAEHLLESGVIAPPCEVGQWLWVVRKDYVSESFRVDAFDDKNFIMIMEDAEHNTSPIYMGLKIWKIPFSFFGKTVFPTKETAEAALKEREQK